MTLTYDEIKKEYKLLCKKYDLPDYEELESTYNISQTIMYYYKSPIKKSLIIAIQRSIADNINSIANFVGGIIYNTNPDIINTETKKLLENHQKEILQEYVNSVRMLRLNWQSQITGFNNDAKVKVIIEMHKYYLSTRNFMNKILNESIENLKNLNIDEVIKPKQEHSGYYG